MSASVQAGRLLSDSRPIKRRSSAIGARFPHPDDPIVFEEAGVKMKMVVAGKPTLGPHGLPIEQPAQTLKAHGSLFISREHIVFVPASSAWAFTYVDVPLGYIVEEVIEKKSLFADEYVKVVAKSYYLDDNGVEENKRVVTLRFQVADQAARVMMILLRQLYRVRCREVFGVPSEPVIQPGVPVTLPSSLNVRRLESRLKAFLEPSRPSVCLDGCPPEHLAIVDPEFPDSIILLSNEEDREMTAVNARIALKAASRLMRTCAALNLLKMRLA